MKNELYYYYNIAAENIHQYNKNYKFYYQGFLYLFVLCEEVEKVKQTYNLYLYVISMGLYCHEIVLNINNEIITNINKSNYLLMKVGIKDSKITIHDIINFKNNYVINVGNKTQFNIQSDWGTLWANKTDYIENQISNLEEKDININGWIYYYIGLSENAIAFFNNNLNQYKEYSICHRRILRTWTLIDLYNPLNFIVDYNVRDVAEYIKNNNKTVLEINELNLKNNELSLIFSRLLFPAQCFDLFHKYVSKEITKEEFEKGKEEIEANKKELIKIISTLNIIQIEPIEWLLN